MEKRIQLVLNYIRRCSEYIDAVFIRERYSYQFSMIHFRRNYDYQDSMSSIQESLTNDFKSLAKLLRNRRTQIRLVLKIEVV